MKSQIPDEMPIVAPEASYAVEVRPSRRPIAHRHPNRLWKCQSHGNHRTISTGPWKSRTEREIPTFPQPIPLFSEKRKNNTQTPARFAGGADGGTLQR
jgi:hypothetical protein